MTGCLILISFMKHINRHDYFAFHFIFLSEILYLIIILKMIFLDKFLKPKISIQMLQQIILKVLYF